MPKTIFSLCLCLVFFALPSRGFASELPSIVQRFLGDQFQFDPQMSLRAEKSAGAITRAIYGQMPGFQTEVWLLRSDGSLAQAFRSINKQRASDVEAPKEQEVNVILGIMAGMFGPALNESFGPDWTQRAHAKAEQIAGMKMSSFTIRAGADLAEQYRKAPPGTRVEQIVIDGLSPWIDYRNLVVEEGTWIQVSRTSFVKEGRERVSLERKGMTRSR